MEKKILNVPNTLTILRFVLSPVFFVLLLVGRVYEGLTVFAFVAFTDLADDWVARSKEQKTACGEMIDPMADKFMVFIAIIALILKFDFPLYGLLILSRDLVSSLGSLLIRYFKTKEAWKVNMFGKLTTAFQVITIISFIIGLEFKLFILLFTIGLSFLTAVIYFVRFIRLTGLNNSANNTS